jgi:hypothetical protein
MSSYSNLSQMIFNVSSKQESFLKQVDNVCKILRPYEEECYLKLMIELSQNLQKLECSAVLYQEGTGV